MHHVAISVHDLDASLGSYAGFGFEKVAQCNLQDGALMITVLAGPNGRLELFSSARPVLASPHLSTIEADLHEIGVKHFALEVCDIATEIERLRISGAAVEGELASSPLGFRYIFVRDPSGNWIELVQP